VKVRVHLFANLRVYAPVGSATDELTLADGATVADVLAALGIPAAIEAVLLVNGRRAQPGMRLHGGDEVTLFPPMEGG
jgi:molybdopterin converting factor small subunit